MLCKIVKPDLSTHLQKFLVRSAFHNFPWKTTIFLYTISWGWLFIIRDSIWSDDWDLFTFRKHTNYDFEDYGFAPWRDIDVILFEFFGAQAFRALTFLSFLLSSVFVFGIQSKIPDIQPSQRRLIALLFLILPFNSSRISLMTFAYTLAYFCFFLAWYLIVVFKGPKIKFFCMILFFLSFQMHSMLFFYCIPVAHYLIISEFRKGAGLYLFIKRNFFLLMLPVFYLIGRAILWPSKNGYHNIDLGQTSILKFISLSFATLFGVWMIRNKFDASRRKNLDLIISGLIILVITTLPYIIYRVYRTSHLFVYDYSVILFGRQGWDSRHQTLQPLGAAILMVGLVSLVPKSLKRVKRSFITLVLLVSILMNLNFGFEAFTEFSKHSKVIAQIENKQDFKQVERYVVEDETTNLNFLNNHYSTKQWAGLIATATDASVYEWFDIVPGVGTSKRLVIGCKLLEEPTPNSDIGASRLILIRGPSSRWHALKNFFAKGEIGYEVQVIDSRFTCIA